MIDVDCPNCGCHCGSLAVKPSQIESVKEATYPQDLDGKGLPGPVSVMQLSEDAFKTKGSVEARVAKWPWREKVTKADVKEIKRLYREGYSLARIRHTHRLSITLTRIMGMVKDRRRK
jgi:hypothetical protein